MRRLLIVASHVPLLTVALALSVHSVWFSQQKIAATLQQPAHCISSEVIVVCYKQARSQGKELTVARNCGDALHQWFPALKAMRVRVMMSCPPPQLHSLLKPFGSPCQDHVRLDQAGVGFLLLPWRLSCQVILCGVTSPPHGMIFLSLQCGVSCGLRSVCFSCTL